MFPAQPFPLVPARLSGSGTAPRGSHVWLSQSSLRAPARGGGRGDLVCVCGFLRERECEVGSVVRLCQFVSHHLAWGDSVNFKAPITFDLCAQHGN